ncbi:MAG: element excision factor XisI family protein [Spirosomataceae bacterium]
MEKIARYQTIVKERLQKFVHQGDSYPVKEYEIFDDQHGHYQIVRVGWTPKNKFVLEIVIYIQVRTDDGKVWIWANWTEHDLATELIQAGIDKTEIVLGFLPEYARHYAEASVA